MGVHECAGLFETFDSHTVGAGKLFAADVGVEFETAAVDNHHTDEYHDDDDKCEPVIELVEDKYRSIELILARGFDMENVVDSLVYGTLLDDSRCRGSTRHVDVIRSGVERDILLLVDVEI